MKEGKTLMFLMAGWDSELKSRETTLKHIQESAKEIELLEAKADKLDALGENAEYEARVGKACIEAFRKKRFYMKETGMLKTGLVFTDVKGLLAWAESEVELLKQSEDCEDMLRKYYGLPPYHGGSNTCKYDAYFGMDINSKFTKEEIEKSKQVLKDKYPEFMK